MKLTRSRPYQKNDNRFVEQKNDSLVRQYFGYLRLDTPEHFHAVNALYEQMWCYYNLFQPVLHLREKITSGDKVKRRWGEAQTPYQRLVATGILTPKQQQHLAGLYEQTNPYLLRKRIYQQIAQLWDEQREAGQLAGAGEREARTSAAAEVLASRSPSSVA